MILLYLKLFWTFFQIGLFGFGGGYAMISMIQGEVVGRHHWMTNGEFTDIVAISQSTPGPIGINSATYVGYTSLTNAGYAPVWGALGSLIATFAVVLPSLILMLAISRFFMKYKNHPAVEQTFMGLRPAVIGLLAAASLLLMNAENFSTPGQNPWQFFISVGLFLFAFIGQQVYKMNPILLLVLCGLSGLLLL
ncbi:MAG: chromate transporter [Bacteroidaceae bacterium]|jgi:chromate transporter|nr:chromate transporter [Bacteroidaceae bacterium]MBQ2043245.1 chromate transporter [Bacteroidaceae bacterium]MBQ5656585.1 chromate transporter [Bacteroidaceae bacterium]MEE1145758.1 chromate transporter [Bacteroidaceae bacterium]MEE1214434.1 chromate transporter [Bacteroidaceae bacterium]